MTTAQEAFEAARSHHLGPAMSAWGFRTRGRGAWLRGDPTRGWLVVDVGGNRHNTAESGEWGVAVSAWPRGTWEWELRRQGSADPKEPDAQRIAPLSADVARVLGSRPDPRPDLASFVRDMDDDAIRTAAEHLLHYVEAAIAWVDSVLEDGTADAHTWPSHVLGAAETTGLWTADRIGLLDRLTAQAQRAEPDAYSSWPHLARWRALAGLPAVELPTWQHRLMQRRPPLDRYPSPRAAFDDRHGSAGPVVHADGTTRPATSTDFPDAALLRAWRSAAIDQDPSTPWRVLLDWGPWSSWLEPAPSTRPATPSLWQRLRRPQP